MSQVISRSKRWIKLRMLAAYVAIKGAIPVRSSTLPKIFILSLHKSATTSTHQLLLAAGLHSVHAPYYINKRKVQDSYIGSEDDHAAIFSKLRYQLKRYVAFSDAPIPVLYKQAIRRFPDARFVLVLREPNAWVHSVRKHVGDRDFRPAERVQYWTYLLEKPSSLVQISDERLANAYTAHTHTVKAYFEGKGISHQLLCVNLDDPECSQKICSFLGVDLVFSMPHANRKDAEA